MSGVAHPDLSDGMPISRRHLLLWGLATVVVTGAGLAASRFVRSPQQTLADAAPPAATTLTAPVERRVLADTVVLRGLVGAGSSIAVAPPAAAGAVVTRVLVAVGDEVGAGAVLVEISGRPIVVLPGALPAYRDLLPGASGDDVSQLQEALSGLGFDPGVRDGVFGGATKDALGDFYASIGYQVPTRGDPVTLTGAEDAVRSAERALTEASAGLEALQQPVPEGATPPTAADLAASRRQVQYAREDVTSAEAALTETQRTSGPMLPMAEVVFVPQLPVRVSAVAAAVGGGLTASPLTIESGDLQVEAGVDLGQAGLLATGMPVEIYSEVLGTSVTGTVSTIGEVTLDEETGLRNRPVVVLPDSPLDATSVGQDVRLTIQAASTDGEVLVVPVSAVFAGADGRTAVLRREPDGTTTRIPVDVGVTGDGYVEVDPGPADLSADDQVVVGTHLDSVGSTATSAG